MKYRWIINAGEIPVMSDRRSTERNDEAYQNFIEFSFRRGYIDANMLSNLLFPNAEHFEKEQIFISHPHSCSAAARKIKHLLSNKYYCFVDVDVWEQVDFILQSLQRKVRATGSLTLSQCNKWAAHMYLLLSQAILREISKSHIILYIESGEENSEIIHSPWLYFELSSVQSLVSSNDALLKESNFSLVSMPVINYSIRELTKGFLRIKLRDLHALLISFPNEIERCVHRRC